MPVNKSYFIALALLFLVIVLLTACSSGKAKTRDKAIQEAMRRDAEKVRNDTQRTGLGICGDDKQCAKGGKNCKSQAVATEPSDCDIPPILKCICPEFKVCAHIYIYVNMKEWRCVSK